MSEKQFHGEGYDPGEFSPQERKQHRHMYAEIDKNFRPISDEKLKLLDDATIVTQAARLIHGLPKTILYLFAIIASAVSAGVWLASKGIL